MNLIPVIDVKDGLAVHAVRGERDKYRPVQSPFCQSSDPVELAVALRSRLGTNHLYLAELDAIAGEPIDERRLQSIGAVTDQLWVDVGCRDESDYCRLDQIRKDWGQAWKIVLPLENLTDSSQLELILAASTDHASIIFSLDMLDGHHLGNERWQQLGDSLAIARHVIELGCEQLLLLDLGSVGAKQGPTSIGLLAQLKSDFPDCGIAIGGGVRNERDLEVLAKAGCDAVLIATAFHSGELGSQHVQRCLGERFS